MSNSRGRPRPLDAVDENAELGILSIRMGEVIPYFKVFLELGNKYFLYEIYPGSSDDKYGS